MLCTYPLEHMAARTPWVNPESTWRIYSALALEAGVSRPVRVDDPRVLVGLLRGASSGTTAIFVNCSADAVAVEPILAGGVELDLQAPLTLEPFGVAVVSGQGAALAHRAHTATEPASAVGAGEGRDARA